MLYWCRLRNCAIDRSALELEQRVFWFAAAHGVVVQRDAADAAVGGEDAGLRLDLLGGEDAVYRGEQRVPVEQVQISRQLLDAVDFAAALDLDRDVRAVGVAA